MIDKLKKYNKDILNIISHWDCGDYYVTECTVSGSNLAQTYFINKESGEVGDFSMNPDNMAILNSKKRIFNHD